MVGRFTFMTAATFEDVDQDHLKTVHEHPLREGYFHSVEKPSSEMVESPTTESISNDLTTSTIASTTMTMTVSTMTHDNHVDVTNERRTYSAAFLASCAELANYSNAAREREASSATWLSDVRRRCFSIRSKCDKYYCYR